MQFNALIYKQTALILIDRNIISHDVEMLANMCYNILHINIWLYIMSVARKKLNQKKTNYFKPIVRISSDGTHLRLYRKDNTKEVKLIETLITNKLKQDILIEFPTLPDLIGNEELDRVIKFAINERKLIEEHLIDSFKNGYVCATPYIPTNSKSLKDTEVDGATLHELGYKVYEFSELLTNEQKLQFFESNDRKKTEIVDLKNDPLKLNVGDIVMAILDGTIKTEEERITLIALRILIQQAFNDRKNYELSGGVGEVNEERLKRKVLSEIECETFAKDINSKIRKNQALKLQLSKDKKGSKENKIYKVLKE